MSLVWMVVATFVLSVIQCGSTSFCCDEVIGPPDGIGAWQYMEFAHGIQLDLDGPRSGGVRVFVAQTDYEEYGYWTAVTVIYRDGEGNNIFIGGASVPPGGGVVEVEGPADGRLWEYVVVQGGSIIGFSVDAVEAVGTTFRAFVPVMEVR